MKDLLEKISRPKVLVIGDIMLDHYIWGDAHRISPEAPVPVVHVQKDTYSAGGAANVALNLVSMGACAEVCGWIGRDEAGRKLTDLLAKNGVVFDPQFYLEGLTTIQKTRIMVQHHQLGRVDREALATEYCFDKETLRNTLESKIREADALIFSDYGKGVISKSLVARLQEISSRHGFLVSLDPQPKHFIQHQGIDLITPNREEALLMAQVQALPREPFPAEEVCRKIWEEYRPKSLVITLGAEGMLVSMEGRILRRVPTVAREVFDVSGAGDTVIAALTAALAAGASLEEAADLANRAAGIVVGKLGTATTSPEELLSYDPA